MRAARLNKSHRTRARMKRATSRTWLATLSGHPATTATSPSQSVSATESFSKLCVNAGSATSSGPARSSFAILALWPWFHTRNPPVFSISFHRKR